MLEQFFDRDAPISVDNSKPVDYRFVDGVATRTRQAGSIVAETWPPERHDIIMLPVAIGVSMSDREPDGDHAFDGSCLVEALQGRPTARAVA